MQDAVARSSVIGQTPVVRPVTDWRKKLISFALDHLAFPSALMRGLVPILVVGKTAFVTRHDDVKEIFLSDRSFGVPYRGKLDVIMDDRPFFLSMGDTPAYRAGTAAMREVVRVEDIAARIIPAVAARATEILDEAAGRIEVVGLARTVAFDVLLDYFGLPPSSIGDIRTWSTRLFEFQFADGNNDPNLDAEIAVIAPAMRHHVQQTIAARRAAGVEKDDVLGRCLARQKSGDRRYSDDAILCALIGFIAGGVPQLPMAAPQIVEQLLRRPAHLAAAARAADANDDDALLGFLFEALRFDAMAKVLQRTALDDCVLAAGTWRARKLKKGTSVLMCMTSAMMDPRRIADPRSFRPDRPAKDYLHFGYGLHECFGRHINRAFLPAVLKPLLRRADLRRETGADGHLRKQGIFPDRLVVLCG